MKDRTAQHPPSIADHAWRWALVAAIAALAIAALGRTNAPAIAQPSAAAESPRVGVVDVVRLVNELDAFKAGQDEVDRLAEQLSAEVERARERAREAQEALELATDRTRERLVNEALAAGIDLRAANANLQVRVRLKQNQVLRSTWASVEVGIEEYAEDAGIDLIISDDSRVEAGIDPDADPETYKRFVMERRVLHAGNATDITDAVITRMNNDFAADAARDAGGR